MGETNLDVIKKRIKKLLALSKSPNENEAAVALEKANALMVGFKITETECRNYVDQQVKATKRYCAYRATLATSICWLYSVYCFRQSYHGVYRFIGDEMDVFFASEMFSYLVKTIERMAKQNIRKTAKLPYKKAYKLGMAKNISNRIHEIGKEVSWAPEREEKRTAIKAFVNTVYVLKDEKPKAKPVYQKALNRGYSDGNNVGLNRQATGSGGRAIGYGG